MHYSHEEEQNKFTTILDEPSESSGGKCSFSLIKELSKYISVIKSSDRCTDEVGIPESPQMIFLNIQNIRERP